MPPELLTLAISLLLVLVTVVVLARLAMHWRARARELHRRRYELTTSIPQKTDATISSTLPDPVTSSQPSAHLHSSEHPPLLVEARTSSVSTNLPPSTDEVEQIGSDPIRRIGDNSGWTDSRSQVSRHNVPIWKIKRDQGRARRKARELEATADRIDDSLDEEMIQLDEQWVSERRRTYTATGTEGGRCTDQENYVFPVEYQAILDELENSGANLLITGGAGTGKSTLIKHYVCNTQKRVAVVSPTGIGALNAGGVTIHSFFGFPVPVTSFRQVAKGRIPTMMALDCLIIDEVSMVRADLFDLVDYALRASRGRPYECFGGVQIILVGDLFQLPPVVATPEEAKLFSTVFRSPFFFDSRVYENAGFQVRQLKHNFRQSESEYVRILNRIRSGGQDSNDLRWLNARVEASFQPDDNDPIVTITPTNAVANSINSIRLARLPGPETVYVAAIGGSFPKGMYPTDVELKLRKGAQVMFLINDSEHRYVNGTVGVVRELGRDNVTVEIPKNKDHPDYLIAVSKYRFKHYSMQIDNDRAELQATQEGEFVQLPLRLAWALTVHKSQGTTLDSAIIDLANGAFAAGQTYVALSRLRTSEGLKLRRPLHMSDIRVDTRVVSFERGHINK